MSSRDEFKKLIYKILIFSLPVLLWVYWQLALPLTQFTFRSWEALLFDSHLYDPDLGEPFYPNQAIHMNEVGDLGAYTKNAVLRPVSFITDEEGYRNDQATCRNPEIVVIGDSMAVGSGLSQENTLAGQLSTELKQCVRSYGSVAVAMDRAVQSIYQMKMSPKVVVMVLVERYIGNVPEFSKIDPAQEKYSIKLNFKNILKRPMSIINYFFRFNSIDFLKKPMMFLSYFKKHNYGSFRTAHGVLGAIKRSTLSLSEREMQAAPDHNAEKEMLFLNPKGPFHAPSVDQIQHDIVAFSRLANQLVDLGAKLVVTYVPNKESIYYDRLGIPRPVFIEPFQAQLNRANFHFIDLFTPYIKGYQQHNLTYHYSDDTHWNENGVKVMVEEIKKYFVTNKF